MQEWKGWHGGRTKDAGRAVGGAGVHKALAGGVGGGEVGADEGLQDAVPAEGLHADVVRVRHDVAARREVRPPVVPAAAQQD